MNCQIQENVNSAADAQSSLNAMLAAERAEREQKREYAICRHAVGVLSEMCAMSPERIIDLMTGELWDEEEASGIKVANLNSTT